MIIYLSKSAHFQWEQFRLAEEGEGEQRMFLLKQTFSNFLSREVSQPASRGGTDQAPPPPTTPRTLLGPPPSAADL